MRKTRYILLAALIGIAHFVVFDGLFWYNFGLGDGGHPVPLPLQITTAVLGAPLMYLLYLPPPTLGSRWWGDDGNLIIGLAVCNALLWGGVASAVVAWYRRRRARSSATA